MTTNKILGVWLLTFLVIGFFFFVPRTVAARSSAPTQRHASSLTVNGKTMAKTAESEVKSNLRKAEILAKALRIPLGADFKAFFTLEPPRGIEAVREELKSKTIYRAIFGVNIPL